MNSNASSGIIGVGDPMSAGNANFMSALQDRLTILRTKLNDPQNKLSNEGLLVLTTELQPIYKKLLMADLDDGVQRQLESFMWNDCFKKPLTYYMKADKALFHFLIESGVGFYLGFIQDLGIQFDVSFIKNSAKTLFCTVPKIKAVVKCTPSKAIVYYVIQNSLVHVGDLLRYRGSFPEALKMYDKSTSVSPSNGHPYNQMGLVQMLIDNKSVDSLLTGVYCYARAVSVANPFIPAQQNLESLLVKARSTRPDSIVDELIISFLHTIEVLVMNLPQTQPLFTFEPAPNSELFPIERLTFAQLFRMMIISLWTWKRESDKGVLGIENNEGKSLELIATIINGILMTGQKEIKDITKYLALAHLNIMMEWIHLYPCVLGNSSFRSNLNTANLCRVANQIFLYEKDYSSIADNLDYVILPEEKKLLGFLPTTRAYEHLQSVMDETDPRAVALRVMRFVRIMKFLIEPRFGLIQRFGDEFKETPYSRVPPNILRPSSQQRRNVALQSIFNQIGSPSSYEMSPSAVQRPDQFTYSENKPKNEPPKKGLLSEALAKALEKERASQNPTPVLPEPELTVAAAAPGPICPIFSDISAETSPTPLSMAGSSFPHPIDTDFSLLFKSIWTPFGTESTNNSNSDNSMWKF